MPPACQKNRLSLKLSVSVVMSGAYKSVLHETRACGNAETSAVGLPTRQTSPHDRGEELQVIVKPADRTGHALAKHAEVFFKVYSSIARWWASVRIFSGGRFRRYCLRIGARNRTIRSQVGLEPTTLRLTARHLHIAVLRRIALYCSISGSYVLLHISKERRECP
jgi:hypothetical protein